MEKQDASTREKILIAAEQLIAIHGLEGFQLKDVANAVGIRPPSVYAHFESREAIARSVADRLFGGIAQTLGVDELAEMGPMNSMLEMVDRVARYFAERPGQLRIVLRDFAQAAFPEADGSSPRGAAWRGMVQAFDEQLQRGVAAGEFRQTRAEFALAQIVGAVSVNLSWWGWDENGQLVLTSEIDEMVAESREMVRRLLAPDPSV